MTDIKEQLEQWIELQSQAHEKQSGAVGSVAKNFVRNDFLAGAHSILPMLLIAVEALEKHSEYAQECRMDWSEYDGRTHLHVASGINSEALNEIKAMMGKCEGNE